MKAWLSLPLATALAACNMAEPLERTYLSRASDTGNVAVNQLVSSGMHTANAPLTLPVHTAALPASIIAAENEEERRLRAIATLALPDAIGKVVRVRETHRTNGSRQEIVLVSDRAPGENVIDVSIRTREADGRDYTPLSIGPPTESGIRNEILSRFPDVQMNIVTRSMRNDLGPFGLAIGRHSSGARCVFAWQWVDDLRERSAASSNFLKLNAAMSGKGLATSIRIRLCRSDSTVDQLAAFVEGLRVGGAEAVERIATLDRTDPNSSPVVTRDVIPGAGAPATPLLRPVSGSLEAAISGPSSSATAATPPSMRIARPATPRVSRTARYVRQEKEAATRAPRQRIRPVEPQQANTPQRPVALSPAPAQVNGQRYLAPLAATGASPLYAPQQPAAPSPALASSGMNLPPQALQGPAWR